MLLNPIVYYYLKAPEPELVVLRERGIFRKYTEIFVDALLSPTVPIVAANYYDPFLAAWVLLPPPEGPQLAVDSLQITQVLNTLLENIYTGFGVKVADVARAYRIADFSNVPGFNLPVNVLLSLAWTWIGAPPPRGPDIHPNVAGYAVITSAFVRAIGAL